MSKKPRVLVITVHPDNSILHVRAHDGGALSERRGKISDGEIDGERHDFITCVAHMKFDVDEELMAGCRWSLQDCGCMMLKGVKHNQVPTEIRMKDDGGLDYSETQEDHKHGTVRGAGSVVVLGSQDKHEVHRIFIDPRGDYVHVWWPVTPSGF